MNTFTIQDMKDFSNYICECANIDAAELFEEWYAEKNKPAKKVIDLSVLIDSQIDCEFYNRGNTSYIAKLETIIPSRDDGAFVYINDKGLYWDRCQPRMNHKHAWQGDKCPLPEGFMVNAWMRGAKTTESRLCTDLRWNHTGGLMDIMYFEVLRVADGYVMPWESE